MLNSIPEYVLVSVSKTKTKTQTLDIIIQNMISLLDVLVLLVTLAQIVNRNSTHVRVPHAITEDHVFQSVHSTIIVNVHSVLLAQTVKQLLTIAHRILACKFFC